MVTGTVDGDTVVMLCGMSCYWTSCA
jgi:hypothetical protein